MVPSHAYMVSLLKSLEQKHGHHSFKKSLGRDTHVVNTRIDVGEYVCTQYNQYFVSHFMLSKIDFRTPDRPAEATREFGSAKPKRAGYLALLHLQFHHHFKPHHHPWGLNNNIMT